MMQDKLRGGVKKGRKREGYLVLSSVHYVLETTSY